ncbi:MAG: Carboxyl-terminal protease (EC [uncultured Thiotrichaceae bacterium]|uniref:Carboxyl-terminal protease (EC) n=1 Tax=uncultured Thiotrichaceae bacterium TaxID=298394 RepID=A0A6S6TRK2_9GAMM|nr:MAG: Carboxyl-terminal protease (EC [uncultured Thiotrichaceae bacterium]
MHSNKRLVIGTLAGALIGVTTSISLNVFAFKQSVDDHQALPLEHLQKFTDVYARIQQDYVETPDGKEMMNNAIRGMLSGLDPHSDYLDAESFKELQVGTSGEFGGLGIEVGMEDGFVKVISPIDDTPAQRAGIEAGDLIIRLDDKPVKGMTLNDAVKVMRGKPGEAIKLLVVREGKDKPFTISVTRDIIKVQSVKSRMLEDGYGYLRISSFQSRTTETLIEAIAKLKEENKGDLKGVVLDLRNNPGGVLNAAVGVSDAFLNDGKIVYTEGRVEDAKMEYNARSGDEINNAPIVVLVNQGSASASEIVAGALQDHKRALILGQKTFGKGSVQTVLPLDEKTALKLTTARYFTPNGRSIQAEGIHPDIEIQQLKLAEDEDDGEKIAPLSEKDFEKHLSNPTQEEGEAATEEVVKTPADVKKGEAEDKSLAKDDYQLYEALNILKGMDLVLKLQKDSAS